MRKGNVILTINEDIRLPVASYGTCYNGKKCKNFQVLLGDGWCVKCYDRSLEKRVRVLNTTKYMKSLEIEYDKKWR